ncbi:TrmB family transcriptional regulator [Halalkalicoccus sp. GCM10025322]
MTLTQMPAALESSNSKLVYLYLATVDEATISNLESTLEMQQLALFPTLDTLESEGLIERDGETFTAIA